MNNAKDAVPTTPDRESLSWVLSQTDRALWAAYHASLTGQLPPAGIPVVFPKYRPGSKNPVRVSEQEAKLLFVVNLSKVGLICSPETPTSQEYRFHEDAKEKRSAQTDLTVYLPTRTPLLNMEFKSGGWSSQRAKRGQIRKDIEKLLREDVDGFWFHTLRKANSKNIGKWWGIICDELQDVADQYRRFPAKELTFHLCVLQQQVSFEMRVVIGAEAIEAGWMKTTPMAEYGLAAGVLNVRQPNNWRVSRAEGCS